MREKWVAQSILALMAISAISIQMPYPVHAQSQAEQQEKLHGSPFFQCGQEIKEKDDGGYISHQEALDSGLVITNLQKRDMIYTYQRYKATGNRECFFQHDPALISQAQSIMVHLSMQTTVNAQWQRDAKDRILGVPHNSWPPIDEFGQIIRGHYGCTPETRGWPMYGWVNDDRARYLAGGHVRITSRDGHIVHGVIEN